MDDGDSNAHGDHNGHEEPYIDIEEIEDQQKALDNYWKIMAMTFASQDEAYVFYNNYGKQHGFSIRKERVKQGKGIGGKVRLRKFVCSREGKRQEKRLTMENRTRRLRPESRCNCKAEFTVKFDKSRQVWCVGKFLDEHNHILARYDEVPFLWSHRKIKDFQKAEIIAMGAAGIRKHMIMQNFISRYGGYDLVGFTRKDIYTMCSKKKKSLLQNGDAATAVGILVGLKEKDPEFFFEYQTDKEGRLKSLFWCDSQARQDYQDFGDVVVFYSTYKMNRYAMPFIPFVGVNHHRKTTVFGCAVVSDEKVETYIWLLETFLKAMRQKKPKSIITDGDAAMMKAIRKVLSDVRHRLCAWHIEKNMQKHLNYLSLQQFRALIYYTTSHDVFEQRWSAYVRKWQTPETKDWLSRMYSKKHLWAAAYLSDGYFLGMKSNQRSESLNSCLHLHLNFGMTLVDLVLHYENCSVRLRETEARENTIDSQTLPVAITNSKDIEKACALVFTQVNFYILQGELKVIDDLEICETIVGNQGYRKFLVSWKNNHKHVFIVEYCPVNLNETIKCSCRRIIRKGLPCKHILHVLKHLKLSEIPSCCVLKRFSKKARGGLPSRRTSGLFGWGWSNAEGRARYGELSQLQAEASHVACNDPFLFNKLKDCLKEIISYKYVQKDKEDVSRSFAKEDSHNFTAHTVPIGDPQKVSTKGGRKKGTNGQTKEDHPTTKNGRPLAFDEMPRRLCGQCKKPGHNKATCSENPK